MNNKSTMNGLCSWKLLFVSCQCPSGYITIMIDKEKVKGLHPHKVTKGKKLPLNSEEFAIVCLKQYQHYKVIKQAFSISYH